MPLALMDILLALPAYALVLFRVSGLVVTAPLYGSSAIPVRVRAAFTMVVAAMIFPVIKQQAPADLTLATVIMSGVAEFMIGAIIGTSLTILLMTALVAGTMIGQQAGLAFSQVVDPLTDLRTSILAQVYSVVATLLFLMIGGHRAAMAALLDTYRAVPLLSFRPGESVVLLMIEMLTGAFVAGIRVAGPVVIALFLTETAVGFLSRTMPQLNIMSVGFTIRLFVALAVAGLSITASEGILTDAIWSGLETVRESFGVDS